MAVSNTGVMPSTEMAGYPMPRMPSKRATANTMPGCLTASPNCCFGTFNPANYRRQLLIVLILCWLNEVFESIWCFYSQWPYPDWWSQTNCLCHTGLKIQFRSERTCLTFSNCSDDASLWNRKINIQGDSGGHILGPLRSQPTQLKAKMSTHSTLCPEWSNEQMEPRGWMIPCQRVQWIPEEESQYWSLQNIGPGQRKMGRSEFMSHVFYIFQERTAELRDSYIHEVGEFFHRCWHCCSWRHIIGSFFK